MCKVLFGHNRRLDLRFPEFYTHRLQCLDRKVVRLNHLDTPLLDLFLQFPHKLQIPHKNDGKHKDDSNFEKIKIQDLMNTNIWIYTFIVTRTYGPGPRGYPTDDQNTIFLK